MYLKTYTFHKHCVNNQLEFAYLDLIIKEVLLDALNHLNIYESSRFYFHIKNLKPSI